MFTLGDPVFEELFFRELKLDGSVYFQGPDEHRLKWLERKAQRQGMPRRRDDGTPWNLTDVVSTGYRNRLIQYKDSAIQALIDGKLDEGVPCIANIEQDCALGFGQLGYMMPALLRRSTMVLLDLKGDEDKVLSSEEHYDTMCWPATKTSPSQPKSIQPALSRLSDNEKRGLIGNGMHIVCAASMVLFALIATCRLDDEGVTSEAGTARSGHQDSGSAVSSKELFDLCGA